MRNIVLFACLVVLLTVTLLYFGTLQAVEGRDVTSPTDQVDQIDLEAGYADKLAKASLPFPNTADFLNVMAVEPDSSAGVAFCGKVHVINRNWVDLGYVRFMAAGDTFMLFPLGSGYERVFQRFCVRGKVIRQVRFD